MNEILSFWDWFWEFAVWKYVFVFMFVCSIIILFTTGNGVIAILTTPITLIGGMILSFFVGYQINYICSIKDEIMENSCVPIYSIHKIDRNRLEDFSNKNITELENIAKSSLKTIDDYMIQAIQNIEFGNGSKIGVPYFNKQGFTKIENAYYDIFSAYLEDKKRYILCKANYCNEKFYKPINTIENNYKNFVKKICK